jgi:hypothetical protein
MDGECSSEMLVNFYQTTQRHIPEDSMPDTRRHESLKANKIHSFTT